MLVSSHILTMIMNPKMSFKLMGWCNQAVFYICGRSEYWYCSDLGQPVHCLAVER